MKKVHVLVEGQTEEVFVRDVLAAHLTERDIWPEPVIVKTKRVKSGGTFKGGVTSAAQVLGDVKRLLADTSAVAVTTILDYYALPSDFPGMASRPPGEPRARVEHVEAEMARAVGDSRFLPHLVFHEYEAWVYSAPEDCGLVFDDATLPARLAEVAARCGGPERIDDGPETAPSKRPLDMFPGYQKTLHGPMAAGAIGLGRIRAACPHAAAWLDRLEGLWGVDRELRAQARSSVTPS